MYAIDNYNSDMKIERIQVITFGIPIRINADACTGYSIYAVILRWNNKWTKIEKGIDKIVSLIETYRKKIKFIQTFF